MILRRSIPIAALALTVAACDEAAGPETVVEPADIALNGTDVSVDVAGSELAVRVMTYGDACVSRHHTDIDVDAARRVVTIRPYNERRLGVCAQPLLFIPHEVSVDPGAGGDWLVRVIGRGPTMPPDSDEVVVEIDAHIAVLVENPNGP